jgi:adenosylcobinamide-GDP ribazoletransferase
MGERFAWNLSTRSILVWGLLLLLASAWTPALLLAPLLLAAWGWFLLRRIGGMSGDMLGAGIEVTETAMLLLVLGVALI